MVRAAVGDCAGEDGAVASDGEAAVAADGSAEGASGDPDAGAEAAADAAGYRRSRPRCPLPPGRSPAPRRATGPAPPRPRPGQPPGQVPPRAGPVDGSASHQGLDPTFTADWARAADDPAFRRAQDDERDRVYFDPAVRQAQADGLRALGRFIYYDAIVMHGPGDGPVSFGGIRATAMRKARTPARGGDETAYLNAFPDARRAAMLTERAHRDTGRVDTEQRWFLQAGNLDLAAPLRWRVHGDAYVIDG